MTAVLVREGEVVLREPSRVMFLYWGRRGITPLALEVARTALADNRYAATISVSRQNERFSAFAAFGSALFPIDTFTTHLGALTQAWRLPMLRRRLVARLRQDRTQVVIELMPHVWSPFVVPVIRATGARYATIVHDAEIHPGDYRSGGVKHLLDLPMREADLVMTLSEAVADRLAITGRVPKSKIVTLALPDLHGDHAPAPQPPAPDAPLKLLFLGRIMPYKGLPLFLDAVDELRANNIPVDVGVFGEGALGPAAQRLSAMGAEVVNRWLAAAEIDAVLGRYHVVVLSHTEASQSGVAALALGAGLPIVATPVGGLREQISHGQTGLLALRCDATAVAEALKRLYRDPSLYRAICRNIANTREQRSVTRFVEDCVAHGLSARKQT